MGPKGNHKHDRFGPLLNYIVSRMTRRGRNRSLKLQNMLVEKNSFRSKNASFFERCLYKSLNYLWGNCYSSWTRPAAISSASRTVCCLASSMLSLKARHCPGLDALLSFLKAGSITAHFSSTSSSATGATGWLARCGTRRSTRCDNR